MAKLEVSRNELGRMKLAYADHFPGRISNTALTNNKTVHRLLNTYFDNFLRNINLKQFDTLFEELDFKTIDDIDALKITLFYFTDKVINGRKCHCQINFSWLNEVWIYEAIRGLLSSWVVKT
ncbi:hypothetical protein CUMW_274740, partial [Citrus unshiu]